MAIADVQTVTLGMGCFWSPDALFGHLTGVIRTRVGYAGGTAANPTYRELGDHTEVVELDFDPRILPLERILDVFWSSHNPLNINEYKGRQYRSLLLYRGEMQHRVIRQVMRYREDQGKSRPATEVAPYSRFYPAEDRHQKYYLKRYPDAIHKLSILYPSPEQLTNATLAARLNGLAKGYTNMEKIIEEIRTWPVGKEERDDMVRLIQRIRW